MRTILLMTVLAMAALGAFHQGQEDDFTVTLAEKMGFSGSEIRDVKNGHIVVKTVSRSSDREVAVFGVARVSGAPEAFLRRLETLQPLRSGKQTLQFGQFSVPPSPRDLAGFSLTDSDVSALEKCHLGDCKVKLPADMILLIDSLGRQADTFPAAVERVMRARMLDYVRSYQARGDSALVTYDDQRQPMALEEGFQFLLKEAPYLFKFVPELHQYLAMFPGAGLPGVEDIYFWSVEDIGLRPLTTLTHMVVDHRKPDDALQALVMFEQIYANHYFQASLRIMGFADARHGEAPGFYLLYLDRSLFDKRVGGLKRHELEGKMEDWVRQRLHAFRSSGP